MFCLVGEEEAIDGEYLSSGFEGTRGFGALNAQSQSGVSPVVPSVAVRAASALAAAAATTTMPYQRRRSSICDLEAVEAVCSAVVRRTSGDRPSSINVRST